MTPTNRNLYLIILIAACFLCCFSTCKEKPTPISRTEKIAQYKEHLKQKRARLKKLMPDLDEDSIGQIYRPNEFLVWSNSSDSLNRWRDRAKARFQEKFKETNIKTCGCEGELMIQRWMIDINERGKSGNSEVASTVGHEDIEENLFLSVDLPIDSPIHQLVFGELPADFSVRPSQNQGDTVVIAIIDTGVDHQFQDSLINGEPAIPLWKNPAPGDSSCYQNDIIGWDFVNKDNNPMDDHSHGTHIASVIAQTIRQHNLDLAFQIMPIKVLQKDGSGGSFDAACGILYAAMNGADIINISWGYYGEKNRLLKTVLAIAQRKGVFTVSSAGNEGVDLSSISHIPSQFAIDESHLLVGMTVVGGLNQEGKLAKASNFRTIDEKKAGFWAAPGRARGWVPKHLQKLVSSEKIGTSVATPVVTAIVANHIAKFPDQKPLQVQINLANAVKATVEPLYIQPYEDEEPFPYYPLNWIEVDSSIIQ